MTFKWLNKQGVESDKGFVLQSIDRFAFEYCEGARVMLLEGEALFGGLGKFSHGFGFGTDLMSASWQPPFQCDQISPGHRARIKENVAEAMTFMGIKAVFE